MYITKRELFGNKEEDFFNKEPLIFRMEIF